MRAYDHRIHAGNAGDVWKHFLLLEVADHLLSSENGLVYAETHVGRPEYQLITPGEWTNGIGRCWPHLPFLRNFCYFNILTDLNQKELRHYPGSACLVLRAARKRSSKLQAEVWDIDPEVSAAWIGTAQIKFHENDGLTGVSTLLERSNPGLLLIDPPYLEPRESEKAANLLRRADEAGWVVLWWHMMGIETLSQQDFEEYSLEFKQAGLDGGRWNGAIMALAGSDGALRKHLKCAILGFLEVMRPK